MEKKQVVAKGKEGKDKPLQLQFTQPSASTWVAANM
jgi:hypothetical protein